ncbi:3-oxoacyl-ACP reductase [Atopomonas sediminilitoris]|uniref:3-oxoacyl-ACP reductase n=1 Tax=Atopomonas sediminilitoris TaxID=2919919 RepID=UPI001F4EC10B|nr:3-oxoacyl-ACP reductase [Atopomonas sediminilitoris]MCJ8169542.1 3-oxoacyl-ACP reductase [Atopomonas sediminilitoris]
MDRYTTFAQSGFGRSLLQAVGMPAPVALQRHQTHSPLLRAPVVIGVARNTAVTQALLRILADSQAVVYAARGEGLDNPHPLAKEANVSLGSVSEGEKLQALLLDVSGVSDSSELKVLLRFLQPHLPQLAASGRVLIVGRPPEACAEPKQATAMRALEGFVRSLGKELRAGGTANLIYVAEGGEAQLDSSVRFFLSPRSAYVSAQHVRITANSACTLDWQKPLAGQVALVTGASRGIGAAIAEVLARDGAKVIGLDIPQAAGELQTAMARLDGEALAVDITAADAPKQIAEALKSHGGVDLLVHNAGITRDKTLARMSDAFWDQVMDINLLSEERINDHLLANKLFKKGARIVCVASISGIAGNRGQTNYGLSKAGVIGMVESMAAPLAKHNISINAVAPGFIETQMTAAIPFAIREAGRRMNSLSQGGLPVDVAETIAWLGNPASNGLSGNVVRVCGQSLLGA